MLARPLSCKKAPKGRPSTCEASGSARERRFTDYSALLFFIADYSDENRKSAYIYFYFLTVWVDVLAALLCQGVIITLPYSSTVYRFLFPCSAA